MSDFDKEAEREKLREKYERDEEKRQATEQMSELLLKGATMTNAHCSDCGDPIFRYDGQEFCPTCQKTVDRGQDEGSEQDADDQDTAGRDEQSAADDGSNIEVTAPGETRVQFGGDGEAANAEEQPADDPSEATSEPQPTDASDADQTDTQQVPSVAPSSTPSEPVAQQSGTAEDDLATAEQLLAATVRQFAQRASESERPREATEHLEAAREAAAALAELRSR